MLHNIKSLQLRKILGFNHTRRVNLEIMLTFWWLEGFPISDLTAAGPTSQSPPWGMFNLRITRIAISDMIGRVLQEPPRLKKVQYPGSTSSKTREHSIDVAHQRQGALWPRAGGAFFNYWILSISIEITEGWNIPKHLLYFDFCSACCTTDWLLKCLSHYWLTLAVLITLLIDFLTKDVTTVFHTYETGLRTGTIHPKVRNADENIHLTNRKCYSRWELKNPWKNWIGKSKKNISYRSKFNASHIGAINLNTNWYPRFSTIYTDRILISQ